MSNDLSANYTLIVHGYAMGRYKSEKFFIGDINDGTIASFTEDPRKILEFFDNSKSDDELLIPKISHHTLYDNREFLVKFLSYIPSSFADFDIFNDYELAWQGVTSDEKDNLKYIDREIWDIALVERAIKYNVLNWYCVKDDQVFGTSNNVLLAWDSHCNDDSGKIEGQYAGDFMYDIIHNHQDLLSVVYIEDTTLKEDIDIEFLDWNEDIPVELVYVVLENNPGIMEEIGYLSDDEDFMKVVDSYDPDLAHKYASERLKDDPSLYTNSEAIKG